MNIKEEKMTEESSSVVSSPTTQQASVVATSCSSTACRVKLSEQQLETVTREELVIHWREQDMFIDLLEAQATSNEGRHTCGLVNYDCYSVSCTQYLICNSEIKTGT